MLNQLRARLKGGPGAVYWREWVRPRILRTRPIPVPASGDGEIHLLTGAQDFLNALWSLKTFLHHTGPLYPLRIHDDGTLRDRHRASFEAHFPGAKVFSRAESDALVDAALASYPACQAYRRRHPLSQKVFDFGTRLEAPKLILMDSDLIFLRRPELIMERVADPAYRRNCVNAGLNFMLNISLEEAAKRFGTSPPELFNSGFGILRSETFNWDWMEEFLTVGDLLAGHIWRVEQTMLALASARLGADLLPRQYLISLQRGLPEGTVMKHYVGPVRELMYREGIRAFTRRGLTRQLFA
jgi:hypothetical protein